MNEDSLSFGDALAAHGHIVPTGLKGGYARGAEFEHILECFDSLVMRSEGAAGAKALLFPPVVSRRLIEQMGYLDNFPQLIGSIHSFFGDEATARDMASRAASGQRWDDMLEATEAMLLPAACYPVYPLLSGLLPEGGRLLTVKGWCFRHEPSDEPTRLQSFRMREFIRAGAPEAVERWRDDWLARGLELLRGLGLPVHSDVANDPFFGKGGRMLAGSQRQQRLKFEIMVPVNSEQVPTAVCSFNWHQEHFSAKFAIRQRGEAAAHTACLGFGLERVVLALLKTHGLEPSRWPESVRRELRLL